MNRKFRYIILLLNDLILCVLTIIFSLIIRTEKWPLWEAWSKPSIIAIILYLLIFHYFKYQNYFFKYFNSKSLKNYFVGFFVYSFFFIALLFFFHFSATPRSVGLIQPILFFTFLVFSRYIARLYLQNKNSKKIENTLIIVADIEPMSKVLNNYGENFSSHYLFSKKSIHWERSIMGKKIKPISELDEIIYRKAEGLLVIDQESVKDLELYWDGLLNCDLRFLQIKSSENNLSLGPVDFYSVIFKENKFIINNKFYNDKCVLVTGAGGSIGSEIVKELSKIRNIHLILVDNNELNLFNIKRDLNKNDYPKITFHLVNSLDEKKINTLFNHYKVDIIIHAAAYKHVELLESQPCIAIENNFLSTKILFNLSKKHNVANFLLVSTDKAVRPTSLMGASKRLAELYCLIKKNETTNLSIVRFGNVINSSGSVFTIFIDQIQKNLPITVTDKQVKRFFMSINQAAKLVLEANSIGKYPLYHLDMGEPQNIYKLAKNLIKLHGYIPIDSSLKKLKDHERLIIITGLKKGEKLYEELLIDKSNLTMKYENIYAFNESIDEDVAELLIKKVEEYINTENKDLLTDILSNQLINYKKSEN